MAGICLNTVTKGNYCWIQTTGKATVLFKTGITAATPADGDLIVIDVGTGLADSLTQSGNPTYLILKAAIGVALAAPTSATASLVLLRHLPEVV
jgi:MinD-like ATPase involved in chromosome partitioning or flagellar assembly